MFTNSEMLKLILREKGLTVTDIYNKFGKSRNVYTSFEKNRFTKKFIRRLEQYVGEDLTVFINR